MNREEFKIFFQKTINDLNLISLKLMNIKNSKEGFEIISQTFQNDFQNLLQSTDGLLKSEKITEALKSYESSIYLKKKNHYILIKNIFKL